MEPRGGGWTAGIRAFQLPGQGPVPRTMGLESALLGSPPWSPYCRGRGRIRGCDPEMEEKQREAGWRGRSGHSGAEGSQQAVEEVGTPCRMPGVGGLERLQPGRLMVSS